MGAGHRGRRFANVSFSGLDDPVRLRAGLRVVLDPEDGRVGVRRNERGIDRRPTGARGLTRIIAALDEHRAGRTLRLELDPVAVPLDVVVQVPGDESRRCETNPRRCESDGRERCNDRNSDDRGTQLLPRTKYTQDLLLSPGNPVSTRLWH